MEWQNVGFWGELDAFGTTEDYINVQIWLYEESKDIEFRYGPHSITHPNESYGGFSGP